jgi:hypothetical protein
VIQKQKHKNYEQEHEMCKTNVKTYIYYANICKHEHEKNMIRIWCKVMPKTSVEQTEGNKRTYMYLYPFRIKLKEVFKEASMCVLNNEFFWKPS